MSAPELDQLIAVEKAAKGPNAAVRARLASRLQASIAAPATQAPTASPLPAAGASLTTKLLVIAGFGISGILGAGIHAALIPWPKGEAVRPDVPVPIVERERPPDQLAQERRLLELAREAVTRNQISDALATLAAHRALYPDGQLAEEREALGVQVLVRAGKYDEAKAAGARFEARYANGLLAPVVKAALESIPVTGSGPAPK